MKPAAFDYVAPRTVPEALDALADGDRRTQVLAGGQSLLLEMHLERIRPDLVVDINRIPELDHMRVIDNTLQVGALIRHRVFESAQAVPGPLGSLFALAVVNIAHPPIRSRGTMVGSFGWGHPASNGAPSPWPWTPTSNCKDAGAPERSRPATTSMARSQRNADPEN